MTYAEKLKDPRWQKRRLEIFEKAGWKCISCDEQSKTLHVHHRRYVAGRNPWDYEDVDLECLCEDCHERISQINKELRERIEELDETQKLLMCGYAYAQKLFDELHGTGIETSVCVLQYNGPEWLSGFADFFGLNEWLLYDLQGEHCGEVPYSKLDAAWMAKNGRGKAN